MDYDDIFKSGVGAVIGFALAQLVNVAKLCWERWTEPKLVIELANERCVLVSHGVEASHGQILDETIYGFYVRNTGRRIATGVRVQLIQIEHRGIKDKEFRTASEHAYDLAQYKGTEGSKTVLVPGAVAVMELALWREDYWAVRPAVGELPDHYEEICGDSTEYKFTVVAFDDNARFVRKVLTVR